jgi:hypothetical protein
VERDQALEVLRAGAQMWSDGDYLPSVKSYYSGKADGVKWAILVLETEDAEDVA